MWVPVAKEKLDSPWWTWPGVRILGAKASLFISLLVVLC